VIPIEQVRQHAARYPSAVVGKVINADLLLAYLALAHDHHDDDASCPEADEPYVASMTLARFIEAHAA